MNFNIIVTSKCNLRCNYCYEGNEKAQKDMSINLANKTVEFIINTLNKLDDIDRRNRVVFHGGEPMLNFELIKFIKTKLEKELEKKYIIDYMTTINGTIINDKIIDFIKKNNISLSISIDGMKSIHDENRVYHDGTGSYNIMKKNLYLLKENGIIPRARMTYQSSNIDKLYENIVDISKLGFEVCVPVADFYDTGWSDEKITLLENQMDKIISDKNLNDMRVSIVNKNILCRQKSDCFGGFTTITISENGDLYPCLFTLGERKFIIGNILNGNGINQDKLKSIFKEIANEPNECNNCNANDLCFGNQCKFLNYMVTGKYNVAPSINCRLTGVELNTYKKLCKGSE
ncbi:TPA: radical SAM protein [Clostridioides difficile]